VGGWEVVFVQVLHRRVAENWEAVLTKQGQRTSYAVRGQAVGRASGRSRCRVEPLVDELCVVVGHAFLRQPRIARNNHGSHSSPVTAGLPILGCRSSCLLECEQPVLQVR
jgi:hypothetical protein